MSEEDKMMPNMPDPINGMIKTYDYSHRNFQRPYSAKTVFFYKDGDDKFRGVRLPVSKSRYRTMESLLDDLNSRVPLDFGVRRVFTPSGKREIQDPHQLEHLGMYVCSSTKWARTVNPEPMSSERASRLKAQLSETPKVHRRVRSHNDSLTASSSAAMKEKEGLRRLASTTSPPMASLTSSKQLLFILQGAPRKVYRALVRPQRVPTMDKFLGEVSQGLSAPVHKLYTMDLKKIDSVEDALGSGETRFLALEKHERPLGLSGNGHARFPPINQHRRTQRKPSVEREKSNTSSGVESLPPLPPKHRRPNPKAPSKDKPPKPKKKGRKKSPKKEVKAEAEEEVPSSPSAAAAAKIQAGARGYLVRKHLRAEAEAAARIQAGARGYLTRKRIRNKLTGELETLVVEGSEEEAAALRLQAAFRHWRAHRRLRHTLHLRSRGGDAAATRIQAAFKGRRARMSIAEDRRAAEIPPVEADYASQEMAATQIQSAFRGYKVRKGLKGAEPQEKLVLVRRLSIAALVPLQRRRPSVYYVDFQDEDFD